MKRQNLRTQRRIRKKRRPFRRNAIPRNKVQGTARAQKARVRGLNAINRVRRGESKSLSHAARVEGTTLISIRRLLPAALFLGRLGTRIRVKAGDPYSVRVEIITDLGPLVVNARGSRERELAGRHRAAVTRVLRGQERASALDQFRGKKVGGHELINDYERLRKMALGGELDHLENLYVSPGTEA
jgi:hypothetical protein